MDTQSYTLIRKGEFHPVFCEDFLISENLGNQYKIGAVMDGCSSGKESHFASALLGKILRKVLKELEFDKKSIFTQSPQAKELSKSIFEKVFKELKQTRQQLYLSLEETLSTLNLMVYDQKRNIAFIHLTGDGFVAIDGKIREIDQDNKPDYLGYHIEQDFEEWYLGQENFFEVEKPKDIAIASDGLDTFRSNQVASEEELDIASFLLIDNSFAKMENMLTRKFNILHKKHGFLPGDDLSIVRWRFV
jgi:hypothetical protein